ncbi:hypothetical protein L861_00020 [Litchfieldella anticariensis FP35 = DSM 16096]|uniref:Uncharacterized protein n=1 Tax=Litchfieldella anticariensis (strain DSM 16096 / CECT 5854 / CIP 108499 / LMG 22089 / FP35) TaxID=1121939 RepID=S2KRW9_LITA3|nr:hypothetical protein L861_00020 [Halomonas anticariensis FP35 = DSM 16096]
MLETRLSIFSCDVSTVTPRFAAFQLVDIGVDLIVSQIVVTCRILRNLGTLIDIAVGQFGGDDAGDL